MNKHTQPAYQNFDGFGGYEGGFTKITQCEECKVVGLYDEFHPSEPCYFCGGKLLEGVGRWIYPKTKWFCFVTIEKGYWCDKNGNRL